MTTLNQNKALVILSGGQDSTTCLFWAIEKYGVENVYAITFDYGQRHRIELSAAMTIADMAGLSDWLKSKVSFNESNSSGRHELVRVPQCLVSSSPLTSNNELDRYEDFEKMEAEVGDKVEKTFVPMRNTFFFTIAANRAVALGIGNLVTGICQGDNANYPDCTEAFRWKLQNAFNQSLGSDDEYGMQILAPLMRLSKADTCKLAFQLEGCWEALAYSHTSYDGKYPPTDPNHSNLLRAEGFRLADLPDPLVIRAYREGLMELPETANYAGLRRHD